MITRHRAHTIPTKPPLFKRNSTNRHQQYDRWIGSATERGYDAAWRKLRDYKLRQSPLCERCEQQGRVTEAKLCHHIQTIKDRPDLRLRIENLFSSCSACHQAIHAALRGDHPIV